MYGSCFDDFFNLWFGINTQLPYSPNTEKQDIPSYFFDEEKRVIGTDFSQKICTSNSL